LFSSYRNFGFGESDEQNFYWDIFIH
jgi:hypothetical protein